MSGRGENPDADRGARKLQGAMLEQQGVAIERMPGLGFALDRFISEIPRQLSTLFIGLSGGGTIEEVRAATLFQAIGDCAGLTAAIYASAEPEARLLIALDERIDDLIVSSIFGESVPGKLDDGAGDDEPQPRTAIEAALVEEFARSLGRALEAAFAPLVPLALTFERLTAISDAFALGRRDMPSAAVRFSLPMNGGACECLVLFPQTFLLPFRKELAHDPTAETHARGPPLVTPDRDQREADAAAGDRHSGGCSHESRRYRQSSVGAVLPLQIGNFDSVRLECSGRGMFLCKLGQGDGRYRLEIGGPIEPTLEALPFRRRVTRPPVAQRPFAIFERDAQTMDEAAIPPEPPSATEEAGPAQLAAVPNLSAILSIPVTVQVVLGSTSLPVASLMKLARGAIISLDQRVGDPVDVVVNGTVVARGEIVVIDEVSQRFGVSLLEIVAGAGLEQAA